MKKVLLVGSTKLTSKILDYMVQAENCLVTGILTSEELFNISYSSESVRNYNFSDLAKTAIVHKIPMYRMQRNMRESELNFWLESLEVDLVLVAGWYHLIPQIWLQRFLCLGIHASLLPKYRGGAPLVWALMEGESETGVTLFRLTKEIDAGPIVLQQSFSIEREDDISHLLEKVVCASIDLTHKLFSNWDSLHFDGDGREVTSKVYSQRTPADGLIGNHEDPQDFVNFVRAQTKPYPGAFLQKNHSIMRIWKSRVSNLSYSENDIGKLFVRDEKLIICLRFGVVEILDYEVEDTNGVKLAMESFISQWNGGLFV
jgi:methionyl-tRNA formyltransferase